MRNNNKCVKSVLYRITLTLLGLFEIYEADEELRRIIEEHMEIEIRTQKNTNGKLVIERLLDVLETDSEQ